MLQNDERHLGISRIFLYHCTKIRSSRGVPKIVLNISKKIPKFFKKTPVIDIFFSRRYMQSVNKFT